MKVLRIMAAAALIALVAVAGIYLVRANETPKAKVAAPKSSAPGAPAQVEVTPADKMRVRTAEGQPDVDLTAYRLAVEGMVENPLSLSFDDIKALPAEERYVKLPCVEGWTEAGIWKGPKLSLLLERAGVKGGAETVVFTSPGGYTTSLTLDDIKATDPILAYDVNGSRLPDEQGYPLRLVVPNRYGYKWIKWVVAIKVIKGFYQGYWESRGYSNSAGATGR